MTTPGTRAATPIRQLVTPAATRQLMFDVAISLLEAGLPLADPTAPTPRGGFEIRPAPQGHGVTAPWTVHHRLSTDHRRGADTLAVMDAMDSALAQVLAALGWHAHAPGDGTVRVTTVRAAEALVGDHHG